MTTTHLTPAELDALLEAARAATPGPWQAFICDDGGEWSGWPLSINSVADPDHTIVRPGGQYPYKWDRKTSQHEAVSNAEFIAAANPATITRLVLMVRELQQAIRTTDGTGVYDEHGNYTLLAQNAIENRIEHFRAKVIAFCKERAAYYEDQADRARNDPVKIRAYARANMASEVRELIESLPLMGTEEE